MNELTRKPDIPKTAVWTVQMNREKRQAYIINTEGKMCGPLTLGEALETIAAFMIEGSIRYQFE